MLKNGEDCSSLIVISDSYLPWAFLFNSLNESCFEATSFSLGCDNNNGHVYLPFASSYESNLEHGLLMYNEGSFVINDKIYVYQGKLLLLSR